VNQNTSDPESKKLGGVGQRSRWLAAELLVVVIGVLIALAIDEWRGTVENAESANEYLHQLIADLRSTEAQMNDVEDYNAAREAATKALVAAFEGRESVTLAEIQTLLAYSGGFDNPVPVLGAAEALVSTGDLRLIGSAATKSAISNYVSRSRDYFLIPLYQYEEEHRDLSLRLRILAQQSGISTQNNGEHSNREATSSVAEFLSNAEAHAVTIALDDNKYGMSWYRDSVAAESAELRLSLESLVPTQ